MILHERNEFLIHLIKIPEIVYHW